jgi:hypothetical protein
MRRTRNLIAAFVVAASMLAAPAVAGQSSSVNNIEAEASSPMVDVLIYRPLGLLGLAASTVLFIPAELVTLIVQPSAWHMPVEALLEKPAKFVFVDPIGTH